MDVGSLNSYTGGLLGLVYAAGPMAKAVITLLLFFSIVSWTIIFVKMRQYKKSEEQADRYFMAIKDATLLRSYFGYLRQ
jgi:biopolymer transport protein TolQ